MKKIWLGLILAGIGWGQTAPYNLQIAQQPLPTVGNVSASYSGGTPGQTYNSYVVIARYGVGNAAPSSPVTIRNLTNNLGSVLISWNAPANPSGTALTYDVIRLPNGATFEANGTCTACYLSNGGSGTTFTDTLGSLAGMNYTLNTYNPFPANVNIALDNVDASAVTLKALLPNGTNLIPPAGSVASTTNTLVGNGIGGAVAAPGTATDCIKVNGTSGPCGAGSGTVTSSGSPVSGAIAAYTTSTNITTATVAQVIALWSACSGTNYLGADGACHAAGTGNALTSNPLSQFAATTSAQLAGVISDETGTGALVFGTAPTITLANGTGLPVATGISGLGTGVGAALASAVSGTGAICLAAGSSCATGGSTSPGGSTTQYQYNNAGAFGGNAGLVLNADGSTSAVAKAIDWATASSQTNAGGTTTLDLSLSNSFIVTASAAAPTIAVNADVHGSGPYHLKLVNDTTARVWSFPGTFQNACQPGAASTYSIQTFTFDGTNYNGSGCTLSEVGVVRSAEAAILSKTTTTGNGVAGFDSTAHLWCGNNNASSGYHCDIPAGTGVTAGDVVNYAAGGIPQDSGQLLSSLTKTICSGTVALGTSAITSAAAATTVTATCTGLASTDTIQLSSNVNIFGVTGYVPSTSGILTISGFPTTNTINVVVVNNTAGTVTPGALTLNYRVTR